MEACMLECSVHDSRVPVSSTMTANARGSIQIHITNFIRLLHSDALILWKVFHWNLSSEQGPILWSCKAENTAWGTSHINVNLVWFCLVIWFCWAILSVLSKFLCLQALSNWAPMHVCFLLSCFSYGVFIQSSMLRQRGPSVPTCQKGKNGKLFL